MNIIKSIKKNTIVLLLITIIVLYFVLKDDFEGIINALKNIDIKYIFIGLILFITSVILRGYTNYLIINDKKKINIIEAIKHNFITQFFNGITPFSTGGQPMEVYMLTEHKIPFAKATTYTIQSFVFYQIALVICGIIAVLYNFIFKLYPKITLLKYLVTLGFIINIVVVVVLLLISNSKKTTNLISRFTIKISKKLKLKIDEENIKNKFEEYYKGSKELKENKKLTIIGISLNIISLICLYSIPLFVLYSMGDFKSINIMTTITTSAYVYLIGGFVPIPGASGGMEYGFNRFYGNFITNAKLSALIILWRLITYYLGMIIGAMIFSLEKKENK